MPSFKVLLPTFTVGEGFTALPVYGKVRLENATVAPETEAVFILNVEDTVPLYLPLPVAVTVAVPALALCNLSPP